MRRYKYRAKDKTTGKVVKGNIQAEDERAAGHLLIEQGYIPQSLNEEGVGLLGEQNRVTNKDRITFTRQLATLIGAGEGTQDEMLYGKQSLMNDISEVVEGTSNAGGQVIITNYITVDGAEDPMEFATEFTRALRMQVRTA